jgi:hypothetical protein
MIDVWKIIKDSKRFISFTVFWIGLGILIMGTVENDIVLKWYGFGVMWAVICITGLSWLYKQLRTEDSDEN